MKRGKLLLVGVVLFSLCTALNAELIPVSRYDVISVTSVNPNDFSGVIGSVATNQTWTGSPGDSYHATFGSSWASAGTWSWTGSPNMSVTNATYNIPSFSADILLSSGSGGTTSLQRSISGAVPPLGQVGGYYAIEGLWSGWGGAYGGRFTIEAVLPGDWSETGPGYMNHDLVNISALWTIVNNFTYNEGNNTTTFLAYVDGYSPAEHSMDANLNVRLYGAAVPGTDPAPVPEPATLLLLGAGLLGLAGYGRKKRI